MIKLIASSFIAFIRNNFALVLILSIALFLRVNRISEYMTFLGDEGRDAIVVYNILHGKFTLLGPTASVGGFFLGPIYYYLMAPFLWLFSYDPVGPAVMVALFGVATVYLVYHVGQEFFSKTAGLIAALLYAISPLTIAYSRSSWQTNPLPFFSIAILYSLYRGVITNTIKWIFFAGILFGIAMQLHYLSLFLGVIIALFVFISGYLMHKKRSLEWLKIVVKWYGIFFAGFIVGFSPFLAFEIRHEFLNIRSIITFVITPVQNPVVTSPSVIIPDVLFRLFARLVTNYASVDQIIAGITTVTISFFSFSYQFPLIWHTSFVVVLIGISCISLIYQVKNSRKEQNKLLAMILMILWFLVGVYLFSFYKKKIYDYYFQFLFPVPFLLTGFSIHLLWKQKFLISKIISSILFIVLVILNSNGYPFKTIGNHQKDQVKKISEFVVSKTEGKPFNFALITLGNSDHAYRYFFKLAGRDPVVIENPTNDPQRKTVTKQLLIVCEDTFCKPLGHPLFEVAGFGRAEIANVWDISVVKVYKLIPYQDSAAEKK